MLKPRQVWETLGIPFPWRSSGWEQTLKPISSEAVPSVCKWGWPPWEKFILIFAWIRDHQNSWLILQRVVQEVVRPKLSPGKIINPVSLCPLPSSNLCPLSYLAPFPLPQCPFPSVLDVVSWLSGLLSFISFLFLDPCQGMAVCANW